MKINKLYIKLFMLSFFTVSVMYASRLVQCNKTLPQLSYESMNITQLQETLEKQSKNGDLPFDMGLELIKTPHI